MATPRRMRVFPSNLIPGTGSRFVSIEFLRSITATLIEQQNLGQYSQIEIRPDPTQQNPFEVYAMVARTDEDVRAEMLAEFFNALRAVPEKGFSREDVQAIIQSVESIADGTK